VLPRSGGLAAGQLGEASFNHPEGDRLAGGLGAAIVEGKLVLAD